MKKSNITDRLTFLAENFDVFDSETKASINEKVDELTADNYVVSHIKSSNKVIAFSSTKINKKNRILKKVSISSDIFSNVIVADPTENKMYIQWMLNVFSRLLKEGGVEDVKSAIRFVEEDLPQAYDYLVLFEDNKRKRKFKELCGVSYVLKHVSDPTDINQYKSLSQLFDAVDPFIEKEPSAVERTLERMVNSKQGLIPVKDRKYTLFIPKTTDASVVFSNYTSWCTARAGNGMFKSYTQNHLKPNGKKSDIYIVIDNKFFTGESQDLYQIHFETGQVKDRNQTSNLNNFSEILAESEGLSNFFKEELLQMAKENKTGIEQNKYLDYLLDFGFKDCLFEILDENTPAIRFMNRKIDRIPDISKFKSLDHIIITDGKMVDIDKSIGSIKNLAILSLPGNLLTTLPKEIGDLKQLVFLNLKGNPITEFPEELSYLDKSNGGSLEIVIAKVEDIGVKNYNKLKQLLPTAVIE